MSILLELGKIYSHPEVFLLIKNVILTGGIGRYSFTRMA